MATALVNAIAEALDAVPDPSPFDGQPAYDAVMKALGMWTDGPSDWMPEADAAADACIAIVAALPADYTAVDVLAALRGEDVPSEPLPAKGVCGVCGADHGFGGVA